jgi:hypothetical protein
MTIPAPRSLFLRSPLQAHVLASSLRKAAKRDEARLAKATACKEATQLKELWLIF